MSLAWEYVIRTQSARKLIKFPCTLFVQNKTSFKKTVFSFENFENIIKVRCWDLTTSNSSCVLPPVQEFLIDNIFETKKFDFCKEEWALFQDCNWWGPFIPNLENRKLYETYFDKFLENFNYFNLHKEHWLWTIFLEKYCPQLNQNKKKLNIISLDRMFDEQIKVEILYEKEWLIWNLWTKYMLQTYGIPGEFIFSSYF